MESVQALRFSHGKSQKHCPESYQHIVKREIPCIPYRFILAAHFQTDGNWLYPNAVNINIPWCKVSPPLRFSYTEIIKTDASEWWLLQVADWGPMLEWGAAEPVQCRQEQHRYPSKAGGFAASLPHNKWRQDGMCKPETCPCQNTIKCKFQYALPLDISGTNLKGRCGNC